MALDHRPGALGHIAAAAALEQSQESSIDPLLGFVTAFGVKCVGGAPQALDHVHHIEHDRDQDTEAVSGMPDAPELVLVAVDEHDPATTMLRISPQCFLECIFDDALGTCSTLATPAYSWDAAIASLWRSSRRMRRTSGGRRYPLTTDPDRSIAVNLAESISFPSSQKIRTIRNYLTTSNENSARQSSLEIVPSSETGRKFPTCPFSCGREMIAQ